MCVATLRVVREDGPFCDRQSLVFRDRHSVLCALCVRPPRVQHHHVPPRSLVDSVRESLRLHAERREGRVAKRLRLCGFALGFPVQVVAGVKLKAWLGRAHVEGDASGGAAHAHGLAEGGGAVDGLVWVDAGDDVAVIKTVWGITYATMHSLQKRKVKCL